MSAGKTDFRSKFFPQEEADGDEPEGTQEAPGSESSQSAADAGTDEYVLWTESCAAQPQTPASVPPVTPRVLRRSTLSQSSCLMQGGQESSDTLPFDEEFQRLIALITDDRILREESVFRSLSRLARDFRFAAMTYGKVIIAEKHLPNQKKTIKPQNLPGLAGGYKYLAGGILFRFAIDRHKIYGSDELAGKEAAHQLRGLTEVASAGVDGLHYPLMALIDYRGYRLVAVSRLPINGKDTLLYGSEDAGINVSAGTDRAKECVSALAKILNLKEHRVKDATGKVFSLHGPVDLEIHKGPHDRLYAVDFARLMPPEPPGLFSSSLPHRLVSFNSSAMEESRDGSPVGDGEYDLEDDDEEYNHRMYAPHLVRLLRPELVRTNLKPLSSDAFSRFGDIDRETNDQEVTEAGMRLLDECIPNAAKALNTLDLAPVAKLAKKMLDNSAGDLTEASSDVGAASVRSLSGVTADGRTITSTLHKNGVNMRHIGRVYKHAIPRWQKQLLNEAISRCIKVRLRAAMRHRMRIVRTAVLTPFLAAIIERLNIVLGAPPCTRPSAAQCSCDASCNCLCTCETNRTAFFNTASPSPRPDDFNASFYTSNSSFAENALEQDKERWWCRRLPQMLHERFGFEPMRSVLGLQDKRSAHSGSRCQCCSCGFSRLVTLPTIFARLSETCGLVLSPPTYTGLLQSLARLPSPNGPKAKSSRTGPVRMPSPQAGNSPSLGMDSEGRELALFDFSEPFEEGSIIDALGQVKMLPFLEYATGTALLIKARNMKYSGSLAEAKRLGLAAKEHYDAGLAQCPTDARLLCNLGFLFEDVLQKPERALSVYQESVEKNPAHARSHYYLALCRLRGKAGYRRDRPDTREENSDNREGTSERHEAHRIDRPAQAKIVKRHFEKALLYSPHNANVLKDYARFKIKTEKDEETAERLLKSALEAEPGHFRASETLGLLYESNHKLQQALHVFRAMSTVRRSFPESTESRTYLIRCLFKLGHVEDGTNLLGTLLNDLTTHRLQNKGHSDRANSGWACKMAELLISIAQAMVTARKTRCSPIVHEVYDSAAYIVSWFHEPTPETSPDHPDQKTRKKYSWVLGQHASHVLYCDCQDYEKPDRVQKLLDDAVRVDPGAKWVRTNVQKQMEGIDPLQHVVLVHSRRSNNGLDDQASFADDDGTVDDDFVLARQNSTAPSWSQVVATPPKKAQPRSASGKYVLRSNGSQAQQLPLKAQLERDGTTKPTIFEGSASTRLDRSSEGASSTILIKEAGNNVSSYAQVASRGRGSGSGPYGKVDHSASAKNPRSPSDAVMPYSKRSPNKE